MDFFNFLYKLSNIFTNKKRLKFFIVVGLIILLIFANNKGVFAASTQDVEALTAYQLALQESVFGLLTDKIRNGENLSSTEFVNNLRSNFVFVETSVNSNVQFIVRLYRINRVDNNVVYNSPQDFTIEGSWEVGATLQSSSTQYDCMLAEFRGPSYTITYGANPYISSGLFTSFYIPDACFGLRSHAVNEFLEAVGERSAIPPTYSTSDSELQSITNAGFASVTNNIQQQTNSINNSIATTNNELNEVNDNLNSINDEVSATNDFLNDTTVDDSIVSLPTENNQDLTSGFFSGLINTFYDNFNRGTIQAIQVPIPFTNKKFNINSAYIKYTVENNEKFATLVEIVQDFWWFALGYYVLIDIYKKINAIKSGDITNIENENISTSLL